jgi:hypothetical protein
VANDHVKKQKTKYPYLIFKTRAWGVVQWQKHVLSKCKTLDSVPSTSRKKKKNYKRKKSVFSECSPLDAEFIGILQEVGLQFFWVFF